MRQQREKITESGQGFFDSSQGSGTPAKKNKGALKSDKTVAFLDKLSNTPYIAFDKVYAQLFGGKDSPKPAHLSCINGPHTTDHEINKAWVNKQYSVETFGDQNETHRELVVSWMICLRETANDAANFDRMALGALALLRGGEQSKKIRLVLRVTDAEYTHNIAKQRLSEIVDGASDFHITNSPRTCLDAHSEYREEARAVGREWMDSVKLAEAEERLGCKITVLLGQDIDHDLRETFIKKLERPFAGPSQKRPPLDVTKLAKFVQDEFNRHNGFRTALRAQLDDRYSHDKQRFGTKCDPVISQNCNIAYLLEEIIRHMILLYTIGDLIDIAFAPDTFIHKRHSSEKNPTPKFYDILDNWSRWLLTSFCKKEALDINFQTNENLFTFIRAEYNPEKLSRKLARTSLPSSPERTKGNNSNTATPKTSELTVMAAPTRRASDDTPILEMARRLVVDEAQKRYQEAGRLNPDDTATVLQFFSDSTRMAEEARKREEEATRREEEAKRRNADLERQLKELTQRMGFLPPPRTEPVQIVPTMVTLQQSSSNLSATTTDKIGSPN